MQSELRAEFPDAPLQVIGVNEYGHESGDPQITEGSQTPFLQDVDTDGNGVSDVWYDVLEITYRDVKILNQQNEVIGTVNLTTPGGYDLREVANYEALKEIMADVALERAFWQNHDDPTDVNSDGQTTAVDALQGINELMFHKIAQPGSKIPLPMPPSLPAPFLDVNGDGWHTPNDVLRVINRLIEQAEEPEGEAVTMKASALQVADLSTLAEGESVDEDIDTTNVVIRQRIPAMQTTSTQSLQDNKETWHRLAEDHLLGEQGKSDVKSIDKSNLVSGKVSGSELSQPWDVAVDSVFCSDKELALFESASRDSIERG